jgi:PKD repeat protein
MKKYLEFFGLSDAYPSAFFHSNENTICRWHNIEFTDDSFDNIVSWHWEFPGGSPSASTVKNPTVQYIDAGTYDVKLTISNGYYSQSITRKNYINVTVCEEIGENTKEMILSVYPNPAHDKIFVRFNHSISKDINISLFDMMGRRVLRKNLSVDGSSDLMILDVSVLPEGIYFLNVLSGDVKATKKIIIR